MPRIDDLLTSQELLCLGMLSTDGPDARTEGYSSEHFFSIYGTTGNTLDDLSSSNIPFEWIRASTKLQSLFIPLHF